MSLAARTSKGVLQLEPVRKPASAGKAPIGAWIARGASSSNDPPAAASAPDAARQPAPVRAPPPPPPKQASLLDLLRTPAAAAPASSGRSPAAAAKPAAASPAPSAAALSMVASAAKGSPAAAAPAARPFGNSRRDDVVVIDCPDDDDEEEEKAVDHDDAAGAFVAVARGSAGGVPASGGADRSAAVVGLAPGVRRLSSTASGGHGGVDGASSSKPRSLSRSSGGGTASGTDDSRRADPHAVSAPAMRLPGLSPLPALPAGKPAASAAKASTSAGHLTLGLLAAPPPVAPAKRGFGLHSYLNGAGANGDGVGDVSGGSRARSASASDRTRAGGYDRRVAVRELPSPKASSSSATAPVAPASPSLPLDLAPFAALARRVLHRVFGFPAFRGVQERGIASVLAHPERDHFFVMPTGAGKSLTAYIPALLLPGVTVVVSPLLSLIQVRGARGVADRVMCGNARATSAAPSRLSSNAGSDCGPRVRRCVTAWHRRACHVLDGRAVRGGGEGSVSRAAQHRAERGSVECSSSGGGGRRHRCFSSSSACTCRLQSWCYRNRSRRPRQHCLLLSASECRRHPWVWGIGVCCRRWWTVGVDGVAAAPHAASPRDCAAGSSRHSSIGCAWRWCRRWQRDRCRRWQQRQLGLRVVSDAQAAVRDAGEGRLIAGVRGCSRSFVRLAVPGHRPAPAVAVRDRRVPLRQVRVRTSAVSCARATECRVLPRCHTSLVCDTAPCLQRVGS